MQMTFVLLRAGLPNSIVAAALALVPIVAIALTPTPRAADAPVRGVDMIIAAGSTAGTSGDQAVSN